MPALVPLPGTVHTLTGQTRVPAVVGYSTELSLNPWALDSLQHWLDAHVRPAEAGAPAWLRVVRDAAVPAEGYRLLVRNGVRITVSDASGLTNALHTLRQLAGPEAFAPRSGPEAELPDVRQPAASRPQPVVLDNLSIEDHPRFGFRGVHLDVARHFIPLAEVLRFVDAAAAHKLNTLHLHLTDDQGWRIEIPEFPRLTSVGAWRADSTLVYGHDGQQHLSGQPHGGYYTAADLREMVAFARARGITVIPEIDVPGHSVAAIAAYPELGVDAPEVDVWTGWGVNDCILDPSDYTLDFYRRVLDTVMDIFDAPIIHIGGDEVPYERWHASGTVRQRAAELGLDSVELLHGWFLGQLVEHIEARGRRAGVWHEAVSPALPRTAVVNAWGDTGTVRDALAAGYDTTISCCSHLYLDYRECDHPEEPSACDPLLSTEKLYDFDPLTAEVLAAAAKTGAQITGIQAQIWTEYLDTPDIRDYHAYPRLAAFAELAWSHSCHYADFVQRLNSGHLTRLAAAGIGFRPLAGPAPHQLRPELAVLCGR